MTNNERALLVNPWIFDFKAYDFWMKPLGLLYVASILRQNDWDIDYIDCLDRYHPTVIKRITKMPVVDQYGRGKFFAEEIEKPEIYNGIQRKYKRYGMPPDILHEILDNLVNPDWIFVTSIMTYWYPGVFNVIKILKAHFPKAPVVLGGIYATLCHEHAKKFSGADYVIPGDAEQHLNTILPEVKPISFLSLPYPSFDLYNKLDYACVLTSRGCCFQCSYCAVPNLTPGFIFRSVKSVIEEIEYYQSLGVKNITFYDDALLANPNFSLILDEIINRKIKLQFHTPNGLHPRFFTQEVADKMYIAGFKTIYLSLETIDSDIHKSIDNKVEVQEFIRAIGYLKKSGFSNSQIHAYLLIGLPEITSRHARESIDFVNHLGITSHLAEYSPIPGTSGFTQLGFNENTDPLLHNNTIFPALTEQQLKEMQEIKTYLSKLRLIPLN